MSDTSVNKAICFTVYEEAIKRLESVLALMIDPPFVSKNRFDPAKHVRLFHRMTIRDSDDGTRTIEVQSYMNAIASYDNLNEDLAQRWAPYIQDGQLVDLAKMYHGQEYWFTRNAVVDISVSSADGLRVYSYYDDRKMTKEYVHLRPSEILKIGQPVHQFTFKHLLQEKS